MRGSRFAGREPQESSPIGWRNEPRAGCARDRHRFQTETLGGRLDHSGPEFAGLIQPRCPQRRRPSVGGVVHPCPRRFVATGRAGPRPARSGPGRINRVLSIRSPMHCSCKTPSMKPESVYTSARQSVDRTASSASSQTPLVARAGCRASISGDLASTAGPPRSPDAMKSRVSRYHG